MLNYYEILGLPNGSGTAEVKAAFRQLAKQFHPDLNPQGKEKFNLILRAYEVLSDPNLKYSYDYKLNASQRTVSQPDASRREKHWKFDEREMKRRQYYNEHIRKYEKKYSHQRTESPPESNYNEFKYILFATPLAVALFLGIMALTSGKRAAMNRLTAVPPGHTIAEIRNGDAPYAEVFGAPWYDRESGISQEFRNSDSTEVIVCLFTPRRFVRSFYMGAGMSAEVPQLPAQTMRIRYASGKNFNTAAKVPGTVVRGAFTKDVKFFENTQHFVPSQVQPVYLGAGQNRSLSPAEFFNITYDQEN